MAARRKRPTNTDTDFILVHLLELHKYIEETFSAATNPVLEHADTDPILTSRGHSFQFTICGMGMGAGAMGWVLWVQLVLVHMVFDCQPLPPVGFFSTS